MWGEPSKWDLVEAAARAIREEDRVAHGLEKSWEALSEAQRNHYRRLAQAAKRVFQ